MVLPICWEISINVLILCFVFFKFPSEKKKYGRCKYFLHWEANFTKQWVKHADIYILNIKEK